MDFSTFPLPSEVRRIFLGCPALERGFLVGGCVRDFILGKTLNDFDIEVYGVDFYTLQNQLKKFGRSDLVGKSFGTLKLRTRCGVELDFSLPRRDSKVGPGHRGFEVSFDPDMSFEEACSRRDFTINAMLLNPIEGKLIDPFNGRKDLENGVLRHVGPAFSEDPLRVLRGMQLAGRFNLTATEETIELCRSIKEDYHELPVERMWPEWQKWACKSIMPSRGLQFLYQCEWLDHYPVLKALESTPQDKEWHPEGDVWTHTKLVCDAMAGLEAYSASPQLVKTVLMLSALTHDLGKPGTTETVFKRGRDRIISHGHDKLGVKLTKEFLNQIHCPVSIRNQVKPLVAEHINGRAATSPKAVRKLAFRLQPATIHELCILMHADLAGRPPRSPAAPEWLLDLAKSSRELSIENKPPTPLIRGKDLMHLGMKPGPHFGPILEKAMAAQLEGEFHDRESALAWLENAQMKKN